MRSELYAAGLAALVTHAVFFIFVGCPGAMAGNLCGNGGGQSQSREVKIGGKSGRKKGHVREPAQGLDSLRDPDQEANSYSAHLGDDRLRYRREANPSAEDVKLFIASLEAFGASVTEISNNKNYGETKSLLEKVIAKSANIMKYTKMHPEVFTNENVKIIAQYYLDLDKETLPQQVQKHVEHQIPKPNSHHQNQDPLQKFNILSKSLKDFGTSFKEFVDKNDHEIIGLIDNVLTKNGNILVMVNKALTSQHDRCDIKEVTKKVKDIAEMYLGETPEHQSHPHNAGHLVVVGHHN